MKYFNGDSLASSTWASKYKQVSDKTPEDMHLRMAKEFYRIDKKYQKEQSKENLSEYGKLREELTEDRIFKYFDRFKYIIPQGSVMSTLGTDMAASLSNCFVAESPLDSYPSINKTDGELISYFVRRCGVGIDISNLRPNTAPTNNTAKQSTGAVSFMHRFSHTTREVAQGGRRGALMISMDGNHPDIKDFATVKSDRTSVTGANISMKISNMFMEAVENNDDYILRFPVDLKINLSKSEIDELPYEKLIEFNGGYIKKINSEEYWKLYMKQARNHAEPGIMFWDNVLNYDPAAVYDEYMPISSNPCGEQFLNANDSCRLIAINLLSFVEKPYTNEAYFNKDKFYEVVYEAMRLGDNLIDLEVEYIDRIITKIQSDPEPFYIKDRDLELWSKSKEVALAGRRIGLGITALGDTFAALGATYGSDKSLEITEEIFKHKMLAELDATIDLSIQRGHFKGWDRDLEYTNNLMDGRKGKNDFFNMLLEEFPEQVKKMWKYSRRNVSWSTVAPTGSVSIVAQVTSGLEPLFSPYFTRRKKVNPGDETVKIDFVDENGDSWEEYPVLHYEFEQWIKNHYGEDISNLSVEKVEELYTKSPWYKSIADDIDWTKRVEIQGIIQKYTTNAISSTVNLPSTVTEDEVNTIYTHAWKKGLKGITTYTDGSRAGVLVKNNNTNNKFKERPNQIECKVLRFRNEKKQWIAFIGLNNGDPYEIFTGINDLDAFPVPSYVEDGYILKVSTPEGSRYDFKYEDNYGYTNIVGGLNRIFSKEYWNYARFTSALMREGVEVANIIKIIDKLEFTNKSLNSWQSGVIRSLSGFIKDGTRSEGSTCEECGSDEVHYMEGCLTCMSCGSSKCG